MALEVIQSVWPIVLGAIVLATLAFLRVLAIFAEQQVTKHDIIVEANTMRHRYLQNRVNGLPTGDWEVVE